MGQSTMPGTDPVAATYSCGHGREHSIPSDRVRVLKFGTGHVAVCGCEGYDIETAEERPHLLGGNTTLLALPDDSPRLWLALDAEADGWWTYNDGHGPEEPLKPDEPTPREKREEVREGYLSEVGA